MTHTVGFFVVPGFQILDLAGPLAAFQEVSGSAAKRYRTLVLSERGGAVPSEDCPAVMTSPAARAGRVDTLVIVGGRGAREAAGVPRLVQLSRSLAQDSPRVASVCTGVFLLAATGLLDGRAATTHWRFCPELQLRHPAVEVLPDRIFVEDGPCWTSAGVTAGIDLALAMIDADRGDAVAVATARDLVVHERRLGGQAQFSSMQQLDPRHDRLRRAWAYARNHLREDLSVDRLATLATMSSRHFARAFRAETGQTPARAVERLRAQAARELLRKGTDSLDRVAQRVGFQSAARMRRAFLRTQGLTAQAIRRTLRERIRL